MVLHVLGSLGERALPFFSLRKNPSVIFSFFLFQYTVSCFRELKIRLSDDVNLSLCVGQA